MGGVKYRPPSTGTSITQWAEGLDVSVGEYYEYNNLLYRVTTAHTTTATFDSTKFQAISNTGTLIIDWAEGLSVSVDEYYEYDDILYKATSAHTTTATFDSTKFQAISDTGTSITNWAEGLTVSVGEYYEYDDVLYKVTEEHTTTGTFDITKFQSISTSNEVLTSVTDGTTNLTGKDKKVKANATSGDVTLNLPTAVGKEDDVVTITKTDSSANTVTIVPDGAETISGDSSRILYYQYQSLVITSDGSNWFVIGESSGGDFVQIVSGTTAPTDTSLYWFDTN